MKAEYVINDTYDIRENRPVGKLYRGKNIYVIETFIEAKRKFMAAFLEFNEKHLKYMKSDREVETLYNLMLKKSKELEELDKTFNKIFKRSKLYELKKEVNKLEEEMNLEKILIVALKSRLVELSSEILNQQEICVRHYILLKEAIDELSIYSLEYLFKTYDLELEKNDDNYFDEEIEMKAVLRDYLYTDSYLILDTTQAKRLAKYYIKD